MIPRERTGSHDRWFESRPSSRVERLPRSARRTPSRVLRAHGEHTRPLVLRDVAGEVAALLSERA